MDILKKKTHKFDRRSLISMFFVFKNTVICADLNSFTNQSGNVQSLIWEYLRQYKYIWEVIWDPSYGRVLDRVGTSENDELSGYCFHNLFPNCFMMVLIPSIIRIKWLFVSLLTLHLSIIIYIFFCVCMSFDIYFGDMQSFSIYSDKTWSISSNTKQIYS